MKTCAECLEEYGSDYFIEKKIEEGEMFKVGRGIYSKKKYVPEIAKFVYKYPNAVVTMKNAFYFHGLTDVIPDECDLATTRDATKIKDERVKQYFIFQMTFSRKELKLLIIKGMIYGFTIKNVC